MLTSVRAAGRCCSLLWTAARKVANYVLFKVDPVAYARRIGVRVGRECRIQSDRFGTEPYLVELGNHVHVGNRVQFLTHDGAVWVARVLMGNPRLDLFGRICVGDNVFLGNDAILLPGRRIGSNVVIGAGSVVASDIPSGVVAAGCPARVVETIDQYIAKRSRQFVECKGKSALEKRKVLIQLYAPAGRSLSGNHEHLGANTR